MTYETLSGRVPNVGDEHPLDDEGYETLVRVPFACLRCESTLRVRALGWGDRCGACGETSPHKLEPCLGCDDPDCCEE